MKNGDVTIRVSIFLIFCWIIKYSRSVINEDSKGRNVLYPFQERAEGEHI
jgi:hypothetical protein